jgi:hypothetical protein
MPNPVAPPACESGYRWFDLLAMIQDHPRELIPANVIAVSGNLAAVPVPLLMPVLVDEVLNVQAAFHSAQSGLKRLNTLTDMHLEPRFPHRHEDLIDGDGLYAALYARQG